LPSGSELVVIANGCSEALIVIDSDFVADCWLGTVESSTLNVVEFVPEVVGVPVMAPDALNVRPGGSDELSLRLQL